MSSKAHGGATERILKTPLLALATATSWRSASLSRAADIPRRHDRDRQALNCDSFPGPPADQVERTLGLREEIQVAQKIVYRGGAVGKTRNFWVGLGLTILT